MPDSLIDVEDFKTVLGVGELYPDADLEQVCQAATNVLLSYLYVYKSYVDQACCEDPPYIKMRTTVAHKLYVGQDVLLANFSGQTHFNGQATVYKVESDTTVIVEKSHNVLTPILDPIPIIPSGIIYDKNSIDHYLDTPVPEVIEAATAIAVDMWQSRLAPGGQINAVDFTPGPYRMGRSLITRVSGLIGEHMDTGGLVG
jgi:hypothetical protein